MAETGGKPSGGQKGDFLRENFDKLAMAAALLVAGGYVYFGYVQDKPSPEVRGAKELVQQVHDSVGESHAPKQPAAAGDLFGRTQRAWTPFVNDFHVKPWTATFASHINLQEGIDTARVKETLERNTRWFITEVVLSEPEVALDSVTVRWKAVEPERKEYTRVDGTIDKYPDNTFPHKFNPFIRYTLQRHAAGAEPAAWETLTTVDAPPDAPFGSFEYRDEKIAARTVYAYRVTAEAGNQTVGRMLAKTFTSKEVSVKTQNVWFLEIKYILPAGGNRERDVAILEVKKFDLERRKMFGPKEFRVVEGDVIGVIVQVDPRTFRETRVVEHPVKDPDTKKEVVLNWDTTFKVVRIERGIAAEFTVRRTGPDGKVVESKRPGTSDRVTYLDDEGKTRMLWSKDPGVPIDERPREKKPEDKPADK
jgi:hypothetical protein